MFGTNAFGWAYPGQSYAGTTTTGGETTDSAIVLIDIEASGTDTFVTAFVDSVITPLILTPSAADTFEGIDSAITPVAVSVSGADVLEHIISDTDTVYIDISNLGGECYSTFSGLVLDAEAYPRWRPGDQADRWLGDDELRWIMVDWSQLHPIEAGEEFTRWSPGIYVGRWSEVENCRWNVESILPARLCA